MAAVFVESVNAADPFTPLREQIGNHSGLPFSVRNDLAGVVTDAPAGTPPTTTPARSRPARRIRVAVIALNPPTLKAPLRRENRM
jgi:hypothetical protein